MTNASHSANHQLGTTPDQISHAEWRWAAGVACIIILVTNIPYIAGFIPKASENVFTGAVFDAEDYYSHLAAMWQGYRGAWNFQLLATPELHKGVYFIYLFYLVLGHAARVLNVPLQWIYHVSRIVLGFLTLLITYRFITLFLDTTKRKLAFLLVCTASGLGWITQIIAPARPPALTPIDFWLIDAYYFFSIMIFPHFSVSIIMLLCGYIAFLRHKVMTATDIILALGASFILSLVHPFLLMVFDLVPILYFGLCAWKIRRWPIRQGIILFCIGLTQLPIVVYDFWILNTRFPFTMWQAQNLTLSPPAHYYILGYGVLVFLTIVGLSTFLKYARHAAFIPIWIGVVLVASYLPWTLQRRFLIGYQVALSVVAAYGVAKLSAWVGGGAYRAWRIKASLILLGAISNIYLVSGYTAMALMEHPTYYHSPDEAVALSWLKTHTTWDETILGAYQTSGRIFGALGHRVVAGHWTETADLANKNRKVAAFFAATTPTTERQAIIERWHIRYVYVGPEEKALGDFAAESSPLLEKVFEQGTVSIYRVSVNAIP